MILNNGRYIVNTDEAELIAETDWIVYADGYSHETHKRFFFYKSFKKENFYFRVMEYKEYLFGWFNRKSGAEGIQLAGVYDKIKCAEEMYCYNLEIPKDMLEEI